MSAKRKLSDIRRWGTASRVHPHHGRDGDPDIVPYNNAAGLPPLRGPPSTFQTPNHDRRDVHHQEDDTDDDREPHLLRFPGFSRRSAERSPRRKVPPEMLSDEHAKASGLMPWMLDDRSDDSGLHLSDASVRMGRLHTEDLDMCDYIIGWETRKHSTRSMLRDRTETAARRIMMQKMMAEGFDLALHAHEDDHTTYSFLLITASLSRLEIEAEEQRIDMPLKDLIEMDTKNFNESCWAFLQSEDIDDYIAMPYSVAMRELFLNIDKPDKLFRQSQRHLMTHAILSSMIISEEEIAAELKEQTRNSDFQAECERVRSLHVMIHYGGLTVALGPHDRTNPVGDDSRTILSRHWSDWQK